VGKQKIIWSYQVINHALNQLAVIKMLMKSNSATVRDHQHRNYSRSGRYSWEQYSAISYSRRKIKIESYIWKQRRNIIDLLML
jgi:hypothetical protein